MWQVLHQWKLKFPEKKYFKKNRNIAYIHESSQIKAGLDKIL